MGAGTLYHVPLFECSFPVRCRSSTVPRAYVSVRIEDVSCRVVFPSRPSVAIINIRRMHNYLLFVLFVALLRSQYEY